MTLGERPQGAAAAIIFQQTNGDWKVAGYAKADDKAVPRTFELPEGSDPESIAGFWYELRAGNNVSSKLLFRGTGKDPTGAYLEVLQRGGFAREARGDEPKFFRLLVPLDQLRLAKIVVVYSYESRLAQGGVSKRPILAEPIVLDGSGLE